MIGTVSRLAAAVLLVDAAMLPAEMPAIAQSSTAYDRAAADALVEALLPPEEIGSLFDVGFDEGVRRSLLAKGEEEVYAAHPGMRDYVWTPIRTEARAAFDRRLPSFQQTVGRALAERMSSEEMRATAAFLQGALGRRMLHALYAMFQDGPLTPEAKRAARQRFMASLTPTEQATGETFAASSAGRKFMQALAASQQSTRAWITQFFANEAPHLRDTYARLRSEFLERSGKTP